MHIKNTFKTHKSIIWKLSYQLLTISLFWQFLIFASPAKAEDSQNNRSKILPTPIQFQPPPDGEAPDTSGGGARDPNQTRCSLNDEPIKALMPKDNFGWTLQEMPSIYIYLPKTSAKKVILAFQDETETYHETAFLPITADSRIISFSLPNNRPPLAIGKNYKWKLSLVCGEIPDVEDPQLEGWVKRIDINSVKTNLKDKTAAEQAYWLADNGYWYDFVNALSQARQENPKHWFDLLKTFDIKNRYNVTDAKYNEVKR